MRFSQVSIALLAAAGCASVPVRAEADLQELKGQVAAQSAQIAAQQRRIEELEVKLAAVAARSEIRPKSAVEKAAPAEKAPVTGAPPRDPRPQLKTVKLGEGRRHRRDYNPVENPVERAPSIPASIALKEPDQDALERLDAAQIDPGIQEELDADHSFAQAVKKLNDGKLREAETELLAFAGLHPRHTAADNALYLAGLIREHDGDCPGAVALFDRVPVSYPAGDAVMPSLLAKGRCLQRLSRKDEARELYARIVREHPEGLEAGTARQLLKNLEIDSGRH